MSEVTTALNDGVLTVTISRPEKKNALTDAMYGALADALEQAEASADIRVVVLRAEGEIFSAGNDLGEFAAQSRNQGPAVRQVERFLRNLVTARTPLVAAVQDGVAPTRDEDDLRERIARARWSPTYGD